MQSPGRDGESAKTAPGLRERIEQFTRTVERQQASLNRLRAARAAGPSHEPEDKAMREVMAHTMAMNAMLRHLDPQPAPSAKSAPLADVVSDLTQQLNQQRELSALVRTAEVVNSSLDLPSVLTHVMDTFIGLTGAERGFVMLQDRVTGKLKVQTARDLDRETISGSDFEISRTIVGSVARDGRPVVTTNAQADPRFSAQESVVLYALRSILCAPLRARGKVTGVIYADNRIKSGLFTKTDETLLAAFADQASIAIENARLHTHVTVARDLMRNVFDSITSGVITVDKDGVISLLNEPAERMLNVSAERCLGSDPRAALGDFGRRVAPMMDNVRARDVKVIGHEIDCTISGRGDLQLALGLAPLKDANDRSLGAVVVLEDLTERRKLERERSLVKRYLPTELVDSLADIDELRLGGARETVSVFFADIRGFTSFSEKHDPVQVMEAINSHFGLAQAAIHANRGIVDKYMGDAVMAHYNTPLRPEIDHALLAVRTAWQTRLAIADYREQNPDATALEFGIGVNTGEAVAGNVGASDYMEYTLIGDAVNLAKRLQENAGPRQILLGERTYRLVREHVDVIELEPLQVKGRQAHEQVYELIGMRD